MCIGNHSKSESSGTGDNDNILDMDICTINGMFGTAIGFDQKRFFKRHIFWYTMQNSSLRVTDIFCHAAVIFFLESKSCMRLTHPITAGFAEFTFAARNNLVGNQTVANFVFCHIDARFDNMSKKFMSWNKRRTNPFCVCFISPG